MGVNGAEKISAYLTIRQQTFSSQRLELRSQMHGIKLRKMRKRRGFTPPFISNSSLLLLMSRFLPPIRLWNEGIRDPLTSKRHQRVPYTGNGVYKVLFFSTWALSKRARLAFLQSRQQTASIYRYTCAGNNLFKTELFGLIKNPFLLSSDRGLSRNLFSRRNARKRSTIISGSLQDHKSAKIADYTRLSRRSQSVKTCPK